MPTLSGVTKGHAMRRQKRDWAALIQQWETFFHHFLGYIFHTEAGKRVRWRFMRETLFRTITYTLGCVPVLLILWYYHLFSADSPVINVTIALLIVDFAFGMAFLRTVYFYRHRVRLVYDDVAPLAAPDPEDMPVAHRHNDGPQDPVDMMEEADESQEFPLDMDDDQMQGLLKEDWTKGDSHGGAVPRIIYECNKCHRRIVVLATEAMTETHCHCGGKIRER
jgi:hypothetical protein